MAGSLCLAALALLPGGLGFLDIVALVLFAFTLPWMVAGFCNALIGFVIMRCSADPVAAVLPAVGLSVMMIRDDVDGDPALRAQRIADADHPQSRADARRTCRLRIHRALPSLSPQRHQRCRVAIGEEALFSELIATWRGRITISYRRRTVNSGFKAGNIRDFCERWGSGHEFAVTLDADSFMPADAIIRLVRIMQVDPKLGILQRADRGTSVDQPVRPYLPVRHASGHALLHNRQRMVAGRLRSLLGTQRDPAPQAVHRALPAALASQ